MSTKTLFRLERKSGDGMWYNADGTFNPSIRTICPGSINATIPMDYSELYKRDGKVWNSACDNLDSLYAWFPKKDMIKLVDNGFMLFEYVVTNWVEIEKGEIIFSQDSVITKTLLPSFKA